MSGSKDPVRVYVQNGTFVGENPAGQTDRAGLS